MKLLAHATRCDTAFLARMQAKAPATAVEAQPVAPSNAEPHAGDPGTAPAPEWSCAVCSTIHSGDKASLLKCEMCQTDRPKWVGRKPNKCMAALERTCLGPLMGLCGCLQCALGAQ